MIIPYNKPPADQVERLAKANELIQAISTYGRRFFYSKARDRVAKMVLSPQGSVCYIDDYSGSVTILHHERWPQFTKGGRLKDLVRAIGQYVETGEQLELGWIGPARDSDGTNIWGYEASEMAKCRTAAVATGVVLAAEIPA